MAIGSLSSTLVASVPEASEPVLGEGGARYPVEFCWFMTLEFGPMWMHTMQEKVIFTWFMWWSNGRPDKGG